MAVDPAGTECDAPALLITRLPGQLLDLPRPVDPYLDQLARVLVLIHSVDGRASTATGYSRYHGSA